MKAAEITALSDNGLRREDLLAVDGIMLSVRVPAGLDTETQFLLVMEEMIKWHAPMDQNAKARVINYIHERHGHYVSIAKPDDQD